MSTLLFILDTIALFVLGQCLFLYAVIIHTNSTYKSPKKFICLALLFLITLAYMIMDFTNLTCHIHGGDVVLRSVDYIGCVLLFLCWLNISATEKKMLQLGVTVSLIEILTDVIFLIYYMADDYTIDHTVQLYWIVISAGFLILKTALAVVIFRNRKSQGLLRHCTKVTSIAILIFIICGYIEDIFISYQHVLPQIGYVALVYINVLAVATAGISILIDLSMNALFPIMAQDQSKLFMLVKETYKLTTREVEIAQFLHKRFTEKEISDTLQISISTVKSHKKNIYEKMDVSNRNELIQRIHSTQK